jgi:tetratricopeptide (TPR) repeat protein
MLKDLDQRRKDTDNGSARVRLTPAADFSRRDKSIKPSYIIAGLSFVVVALGFAWVQISNNTGGRPETQPQVELSPLVAELSLQSEPVEVAIQVQPVITAASTFERSLGVNEIDREPAKLESILSLVTKKNEMEQNRQLSVSVPSASRNEVQKSVASESKLIANVVAPKNNVDLTAGIGDSGTVKNSAIVSEDEQDTLAVQEALELIANNQLADAYKVLEKYISNNRYAHQSRETYAKLLVSAGLYQEAYNLLDEGLSLTPNHPGFKKVRARILILNGQVLDAVEMLLSRAPRVADDLEYHEILASAQLATKDFAGASISYSSLVGENQREGKFWYGYAASQELLGNTEVAKQAYAQALRQASLTAGLRRRSQDRLLALGQ